jgi:hypothetical protein
MKICTKCQKPRSKKSYIESKEICQFCSGEALVRFRKHKREYGRRNYIPHPRPKIPAEKRPRCSECGALSKHIDRLYEHPYDHRIIEEILQTCSEY